MRDLISPFAGIALFCWLAACTSLQWERAGTDAVTADEDLRQCEQFAKDSARRSPGTREQPAVVVSGRGEVGVTLPSTPAPRSDPVVEYDALTACMRGKGYRQGSRP